MKAYRPLAWTVLALALLATILSDPMSGEPVVVPEAASGRNGEQIPVLDTAWTVGLHSSVDGAEGSFGYINQLVATSDDDVWALDILLRRMTAHDRTGRERLAFGRRGSGPGEFQDPISMAVTETHVVVRDLGHRAYIVFDKEGSFEARVPTPEDQAHRDPMVADGSGRIWDARRFYADSTRQHVLYAFRPAEDDHASVEASLPWSVHPAIHVVGSDGERSAGYTQLPFAPRFHWTVDRDGRVLTAHGAAYEIDVWEDDRLSQTWERPARHIPVPPPVADSMAAMVRDEIVERAERVSIDPSALLEQVRPPEVWPEILGLSTDAEGRVWVRVAPDTARVLAFDVLSASGDLVRRVRLGLPTSQEPLPGVFAVGPGMAFAGLRSPLGVHGIAAYRIEGPRVP